MEKNKELIIVIPSYEPDNKLIELIDKLNNYFNDFKMVVINDGSKGFDSIFDVAKNKKNVIFLEHDVNKGKGEALKTAFRYIKDYEKNFVIVTADSDGQHKPEDIKRVYDFYISHDYKVVLGSRKFENDVPKRSTFGNDVARGLLRLVENKHLNDTQTGLRAFDDSLIDFMLEIKGSRYEYEMNMLAELIRAGISIGELAIETIYINENKGSHFRPVRDFSRISACTMKYMIPFIITMIINLIAFISMDVIINNPSFTQYMLMNLMSLALGLVVNMVITIFGIFYGNKYIFEKKKKFFRYLIVGIILIGLSVLLFWLFDLFLNNYVLIKILTDLIVGIILLFINCFVLKKSKMHEE